jgi:ATP-dependent Clp protease protease subunit
MSICSKDTKLTKKKTKKTKTKSEEATTTMTQNGVEALIDGDAETAIEQHINPMAIPDYFNNIRNNYYVANRVIWLTDDIEWPIITEVLKKLAFADDKTNDPIWLFIGSCGGLCDAGMALIDMIERLKKKKLIVNTVCVGSCSSMAAIILASGSKGHRYAYPSSRIMIHQAKIMMVGGSYAEVANETKELKYWTETIAKSLQKVTKKSPKEIEKAMSYDNYMSASEAKKFGLVDKIEAVIP